ncbi:hypothetical protein [Saccharopolyspora aridisoli]|nr:hypothetical protein [Saccharopolyspora aridisoli]
MPAHDVAAYSPDDVRGLSPHLEQRLRRCSRQSSGSVLDEGY